MGRSWPYGKAIVDGGVRYFSPSALMLGDSSTEEGCLRKYYYQYVMGLKGPQTAAQDVGVALHAENEQYLKTGVNALGSLALRGKHMLPDPGADLLIEHDIVIPPAVEFAARQHEAEGFPLQGILIRKNAVLEKAPLRVQGIPVVGYIDLVHGRCENKGVADIEDTVDPPGTVEVVDWKTTSKIDYIKSPSEMSKTIQMTVYGKWVTTTLPDTSHVRLSHGYYLTKGPILPRKVTLRVLPEQIDRQWERVERVAGSIIEIVRENDPDKIPANTRACTAFGGCPYRASPAACKAGTQQGLANFFGRTGAENMIKRMNEVTVPAPSNIAARLAASKNPLLKKVADDPAVLRVESLRLAREEVEAQYPGVPAAWDAIKSFKIGQPQFSGELARIVGELEGTPISRGAGLLGCGELQTYGPFSDPAEISDLLKEIQDSVNTPTTAAAVVVDDDLVPLLAPEAPVSDPSLASAGPKPTTVVDRPLAVTEATADSDIVLEPIKRRGRPKKIVSAQDTTSQVMTSQDSTAPSIIATTPTLTVDMEVMEEQVSEVVANDHSVHVNNIVPFTKAPPSRPVDSSIMGTPEDGQICFYVDALPSCPYQSFWPIVSKIVDFLNEQVSSVGTMRDFRLVDNTHGLAYGKWKGAIAACLREINIAPGHYVFDGTYGEIAQVVTETMREIVTKRGGVYIRGIK